MDSARNGPRIVADIREVFERVNWLIGLPLRLIHEQRCSIVDRLVLLFVFLKEYLCECTRMFFSSFPCEQAAARCQSTFETVNLFPEFTSLS